MIQRYTRPEMGRIWTDENKFKKWLHIELLTCEAWAEMGEIPLQALKEIKEKARFDIERIAELEKVTKHDVVAFLTAVGEHVGEASRYIHFGLTSSDILDTSLALLLKESSELIIEDIRNFLSVLKEKAFTYKDTIMIGRSHGIHAEPITFGLKMALWYDEMHRNLTRMERAKEAISCGKISGAVGTFAHTPPFVEDYVCRKCGLKPSPVSTQIIQRDHHAEFFTTLAIIASSIEKFAVEIRHLQRTEVLEAEEFFTKGQKGSSAMPHKRNPILSENLCGLARLVRANSLATLENISLWHERDISHSSVERVIAPDSTILVDYMLNRVTTIIAKLLVYPENMASNLEKTKGLIFSERLMLELTKRKISREEAYSMVQRNAMNVWEEGTDFKEVILKDRKISTVLTRKEIEECFDLHSHLRHVDEIFQRVFGDDA
ncbi:MAG: adenylosuccinate lyase [Syntrophobacterales bacterium]|nr:MAG: adenylosuccinate lyase [Syntrophobacterales bacterium]